MTVLFFYTFHLYNKNIINITIIIIAIFIRSSRQFGLAVVNIRQLPVDVFRRQDHSSRHGNSNSTPFPQRVCDGLADESVGRYGRGVLGAHHWIGILVFGRIHRTPAGKTAFYT